MAKVTVTAQPGSQNINIDVVINAPLEKVFKAYTELDLLKQWWGQGEPMDVPYYEGGTGGKWRFVQKKDGNEYGFFGSLHSVIPGKMAIQTFEFEGLPEAGHVALDKAEFSANDDGTTSVNVTSTYQSVEDRDGMIASGMEGGFRQSIEALEKLLTK